MSATADEGVAAVVERLRAVLETSGATYAFGDAIALAAWSEPRATADVDVVVWVEPETVHEAVALVRAADALVEMLDQDERIMSWDTLCDRVPTS